MRWRQARACGCACSLRGYRRVRRPGCARLQPGSSLRTSRIGSPTSPGRRCARRSSSVCSRRSGTRRLRRRARRSFAALLGELELGRPRRHRRAADPSRPARGLGSARVRGDARGAALGDRRGRDPARRGAVRRRTPLDPVLARRADSGRAGRARTRSTSFAHGSPGCRAGRSRRSRSPPSSGGPSWRWWRAVEADAEAMVRSHRAGREAVVGAVALLALDAVRVATALAVAAQAARRTPGRCSMPSADLVATGADEPGRGGRARARTREVLVELARAGCVELVGACHPPRVRRSRRCAGSSAPAGPPARRPRLLASAPDVAALERAGRRDLLAGEVELGRRARLAVDARQLRRLGRLGADSRAAGARERLGRWARRWSSCRARPGSSRRRCCAGAAGAALPSARAGVRNRPLPRRRPDAVHRRLVRAHVRDDVRRRRPRARARAARDSGCARRRRGRFAALRPLWAIPFAAGLAAACFGLLYGEVFGPTDLVPRLWLDPLDRPVPLLLRRARASERVCWSSATCSGSSTAGARAGSAVALLDQSGVAGLTLFVGAAIFAGGLLLAVLAVEIVGGVLAGDRACAARAGARARRGRRRGRGDAGRGRARRRGHPPGFERDLVHAAGRVRADARGARRWSCSRPLGRSGAGSPAPSRRRSCSFSATWSRSRSRLLVTGVQALRLEYYELFSRIFSGEGHAFAPWNLPVVLSRRNHDRLAVVGVAGRGGRVRGDHRGPAQGTGSGFRRLLALNGVLMLAASLLPRCCCSAWSSRPRRRPRAPAARTRGRRCSAPGSRSPARRSAPGSRSPTRARRRSRR